MPSPIGTRWSCKRRTSVTVRVLVRLRDRRAGEVAGGAVAVSVRFERRLDLGADRLRKRAARAEAATAWRVHRARNVAVEHDPLLLAARHRPRDRGPER